MVWVRVTGVTTRWRRGGRGGAQRPPGPGSNELILLADKDPVGVEVIDRVRRAAQRPAEDSSINCGPGTAAAAAIHVEKTSLLRLLNESVILEHRRLATARTAVGPRRGCAGRPWVRSLVPPMIANGRVKVYPPRVLDDGGGGGAPGTLQARSWGCVSVAWRGPPYASWLMWMHISLLWDFLTGSVASPLQLVFVKNNNPICVDLGSAHDVFIKGYHQLWFQEVDMDRMDKVVDLGGQRWCQG
jgi:hypothetical protein